MTVESELSKDGRFVRIAPVGRFDFNCHHEFRDAYSNRNSDLTYIIDLRRAQYMDSSALGMLLLLREHAGGDAARVVIENAQKEIRSILDVANFEKLFDIR